jgi:Flp pilus assembly protein CpaB
MAKNKITLINIVQQFPSESDSTITQRVTIENDKQEGEWITVAHNGVELSMAYNNWQELIKLSELTRKRFNLKQ